MALEALVENHPDLVKVGFRVASDIRPIQYLSGATLVGLSQDRGSGCSYYGCPDLTLKKKIGSYRQEEQYLDLTLTEN